MEGADALTLARLSPGALCWYDLRSEETGDSIYEQPPHLKLLDDEIVACCNGWGDYADESIKGIIFTVPPRHGKSFKVSHYTPPWYLGKWPQRSSAAPTRCAPVLPRWPRPRRPTSSCW